MKDERTNWKSWIIPVVILLLVIIILFTIAIWRIDSTGGDEDFESSPVESPSDSEEEESEENRMTSSPLREEKRKKNPKKINPKKGRTPRVITIPMKPKNQASIRKTIVRKALPKVLPGTKQKERKVKQNKYEKLCSKVLQDFYGVEFKSYRPDFLKNPLTGKPLELDCYNPTVQIAVEYNGIQHYVYPNWAHKSRKEFESQVQRDAYKKEVCDREGVYLITVPYTVDYDLIPDYIRSLLPRAHSEPPSNQPFVNLEENNRRRLPRGPEARQKRQDFFRDHHIHDPSFVPMG